MKLKIIAFCFYTFFFTSNHCAQTMRDSTGTTFYLSGAIGYKYNLQSYHPMAGYERKVFQSHESFILDAAFTLGENNQDLIGLEITGFPWKYGDESMSPKYFTLIFTPFYGTSFPLKENIKFNAEFGLSLFSNDPSHILSVSVNAGFSRDFGSYEVFIKNNFRLAPPFMLDSPPWIVLIGTSYKL